MTWDKNRLAGLALLIGGMVTVAGYAVVNLFLGTDGPQRFLDPRFEGLYSIALAGDLLVVLGLPAVFVANRGRAPILTIVGYVGTMLAIVMLNIGEGTTEVYVKPYLMANGGLPDSGPAGFETFTTVAIVAMIIGLISLGIAFIRARVLPAWVGALLILSVPLSIVPLPGPLFMAGDYVVFLGLAVIGWSVAFSERVRGVAVGPARPEAIARAA
jgi:hypothetical protein